MIYVTKMHTRYPELHGGGYYNFLMEHNWLELQAKIEEYSHDFQFIKTVKTRFATKDNLHKKYPTKQKLNESLFK